MKNLLIENIIYEEYSDMIQEYESNNTNKFNFNENFDSPQFLNYDELINDPNIDINQSNILINWDANLWLNNSGIENFSINVNDVTGNFIIERYDNSGTTIEEIEKNIKDFEWKIDIDDSNAILKIGKSLYIQNVIFDFKNKTCIVVF
jgi:hypothetical protein